MCDTVVVTGEASRDGVTLFGKNSDREPNEAHHVVVMPAADHPAGSSVQCTYVQVPQVAHTFGVLLCKPWWIWGAEMGVNEHGVAIGNEAVFTRVPYEKGPGLIGMDFLRLALERAATARDAVTVITSLLDQFGQGGSCKYNKKMYYHNSFLIADPHDAWVLETAGREWAARRVRGVYTISNAITIGNTWDLASDDLVSDAVEKGWCKGRQDFDFGRCYSDTIYTRFAAGHYRRQCTLDFLSRSAGKNSVLSVIAALRSHGTAADWSPDRGITGSVPCMHAGWGPVRGSQSTGSLVCHLDQQQPTYFVTATAAPCTSIFKPAWLDVPLPPMGPAPTDTYDAACLYWRHEALHRATLQDFSARLSAYAGERDGMEQDWVEAALRMASAPADERAALSARVFAEADAAEARWLARVVQMPMIRGQGRLHRKAWTAFNREAKMP